MSAKDEALAPFKNLQKRLVEIGDSLGLTVERFIIAPDANGLDTLQVVFAVRADAVMSESEKEQARMDKQFDEIQREIQEQEFLEKKMPSVVDDLKDWFGK